MEENNMDIDQYEYLWTNKNYNYALIKTTLGYVIVNRVSGEVLLIENEILEQEIIRQMLHRGVPVYNSPKDLENHCAPINIVGQPTLHDEFPVKRYKVSIVWASDIPLTVQVKELKKAFLKKYSYTNQEVLDIARKNTKWQFDILYLDESQKKEIENLAEKYKLKIIFELDELRERF